MVEERSFGVPPDVLACLFYLQVFFLKVFDFFRVIFLPAATQIHKFLKGYFPIMDRKQQRVKVKPGPVDFALASVGDAGEVGQIPIFVEFLADFFGIIQLIARGEEQPIFHEFFDFISVDRQELYFLIFLSDEFKCFHSLKIFFGQCITNRLVLRVRKFMWLTKLFTNILI